MTKSTLFTTLAAAALAFGLAACDEQQASDSSVQPMQEQQGAMPPAQDSGSAPSAMPPAEEPATEQPDTGGSSTQ